MYDRSINTRKSSRLKDKAPVDYTLTRKRTEEPAGSPNPTRLTMDRSLGEKVTHTDLSDEVRMDYNNPAK